MPDTDTSKKPATPKSKMTAAQAAKMVHRIVPDLDKKGQPETDSDGNLKTKQIPIKESDVLNYADYPDRVVVVTTAGEKLVHTK